MDISSVYRKRFMRKIDLKVKVEKWTELERYITVTTGSQDTKEDGG